MELNSIIQKQQERVDEKHKEQYHEGIRSDMKSLMLQNAREIVESYKRYMEGRRFEEFKIEKEFQKNDTIANKEWNSCVEETISKLNNDLNSINNLIK